MRKSPLARTSSDPKKKAVIALMTSLGPKPRKGFVIECENCRKLTYKKPCYRGRFTKMFCSRECQSNFSIKNSFIVNCKVCLKPFHALPFQVKHKGRINCSRACSKVWKRKAAEERRIKNGYTKHQLDRLARYSPEAKEWREKIFERDNFTCQICYIRGGKLEADHIKPWAYFPKLRFELSNGRTLCRLCHDKTKMDFRTMRKLYSNEKITA